MRAMRTANTSSQDNDTAWEAMLVDKNVDQIMWNDGQILIAVPKKVELEYVTVVASDSVSLHFPDGLELAYVEFFEPIPFIWI